MRAGYIPIRVLVITNKPHGEVVEVMEEYRPKPPADGRYVLNTRRRGVTHCAMNRTIC